MAVPLPSAESIAHRARLASLVSQLRPTQFRTHLTRLPAHRIPTLWTLYRGVLRDAPNDTVRLFRWLYNETDGAVRWRSLLREGKAWYGWC